MSSPAADSGTDAVAVNEDWIWPSIRLAGFEITKRGVMIGLIGLSMVVFIFSFGPGDALTQWLRPGGGSHGEVVTTLHGKKIRESDIGRTANGRKLASTFLYNTVDKGQREVAKDISAQIQDQSKSKSNADLKESPKFAGLQTTLMMYESINRMVTQPSRNMSPQQIQQTVQNYAENMGSTLRNLEAGAAKPDLDAADRLIYVQVATLLGFQRQILARNPGDAYYFGGGSKTEDILDFRLWQLQADRLGIKLTDADVVKEVIAESAHSKVLDPTKAFADQEQVRLYIAAQGRDKNNPVTPKNLMDALREEFRVVMAQGALLGVEPGVRAYRSELTTSATPSLATPDEFFDYFRDQRTALRVKLFPITAESYLPEVKGQPTDAELLARYERGAKSEPMPFGRESGYKQPRRIKVEYVLASPEDAYYKKLATEQIASLRKLSEPNGRLSSAVISFIAPGIARMVPLALDPLGKDFDDLLKEDYGWIGNDKGSIDEMTKRAEKRHFTSVTNPASVASLVGGFQGGLLHALASLDGTSTGVEMRRMVPFNLHLLLSQSSPENLFGAAAAAVQTMPPETPRSMLEPQILVAKEKSLAEDALRTNFETMQNELRKLGKKPAEARAYIAKAIQEYHLSIHAMPRALTVQDFLEELKTKKDKLNLDLLRKGILSDFGRAWNPNENTLQQTRQFINYIFQGTGTYAPAPGGRIGDTKQELYFWRTEDQRAEERTFSQVRGEVVAAWRLDKARALARTHAEKLEAQVNKEKATPADAERILKEQKLVPFELDNVTQVAAPAREVIPGLPTDYRPYQIPEDKAELLPYPPQDFVKQLMKLTRPGDATVVVDSPAKTFYVALLIDRTEPSIADFKSVYVRSPHSDPMYMHLVRQRREEYRKSVMEQLRREASADLDKEGRFKLPESVRKNDTGQYGEE